MSDWRIAPFNSKTHDRLSFSSGAPELDAYIQHYASQAVKQDIAWVYAAFEGASDKVAGYYSISASSFEPKGLPPETAKRLPRYPVPAVLLGKFAIDQRFQKRGVGSLLLMHVFERVLSIAETAGVHSLIVDARDEEAARYYLKRKFLPFADDKHRLFLPVREIRQMAGRPNPG